MASVNYASKYEKAIDEVYRLASVTNSVVNKGIRLDYQGVNAVTIYTVTTVSEVNYTRTGSNRFGPLSELATGKETFTLSQDKAFTYTIDRGNYEDQMMTVEAGDTLKRQIEVVAVPNTDTYRLTTAQAYCVAQSQTNTHSGTALSASNVFTYILDAQAILDNLFVPAKGRVLYVPPASLNFLKLDTNFNPASEIAAEERRNGQVGEVDGIAIVKVPVSYLPTNTGFLLLHEEVLVAPHKFDTYRILKEVQGVDGWVVEGRRYYDCFIPTNRGKAMVVHMNA